MKIFTSIPALKIWLKDNKSNNASIGYVPTMGFLHEGHEALLNKAIEENDLVVLSIFVNPLQFGENEDFDRYPKNIEKDIEVAKKYGVDAIFHPSVHEMYPSEMSATFKVHHMDVLCGAKRPGHFDGVATVVMKLFGIVTPDRAYFGLKDAQQVAVIERLVKDYHLNIDIVRVPTVRENDGLAKSSRNVNLTKSERAEAPYIYKTLLEVKNWILDERCYDTDKIEVKLKTLLSKRLSGNLDYAEVRGFPSLKKMKTLSSDVMIAVAIKYSKARLIDNVIFHLEEKEGKLCIDK
ncbi:pantoate--beta-alanine ligase [Evansella cellulosilytica]|uniref:Pantothenate synthetase n=1 Tax=Evansella cellulosilytica (strain ATCC 21833 / DSM 2522 / FERM P-1141 / JCM 9156 / N-4) TaxID=649639 RepID=E6TZJ2_EVAC2|nr:pantoate--beta-alanine ligase [Evansella cellulosilytica]ADU30166.1 pantoate/beta-alanine ligase [Evansella cellulosilytica DSM 2522]